MGYKLLRKKEKMGDLFPLWLSKQDETEHPKVLKMSIKYKDCKEGMSTFIVYLTWGSIEFF